MSAVMINFHKVWDLYAPCRHILNRPATSQKDKSDFEEKVICYQLQLRKKLADVLTECFSHHKGGSEEVRTNIAICRRILNHLATPQTDTSDFHVRIKHMRPQKFGIMQQHNASNAHISTHVHMKRTRSQKFF